MKVPTDKDDTIDDLNEATMRSLLLIGFVAAFFAIPMQAADPPQKIFLLIGQSNMSGRAPLEPGDEKPIDGVLLLNEKGEWEPATNPFNRYSSVKKSVAINKIGPGYGFVLKLRELDPKATIGIVANSRGGSKIEEWGKTGALYLSTMKRLKEAKVEKFAGVLWHQGESNANDQEYFTKLSDLVERLRKDLNDPNLPFVAGEIAAMSHVNEVFREMPKKIKNTALAAGEGLKLIDSVHFNRESQLLLGKRYAEAYWGLVNGAK